MTTLIAWFAAWNQTLTQTDMALIVVVFVWTAYLVAARVIERHEEREQEAREARPILDLLDGIDGWCECREDAYEPRLVSPEPRRVQ